MPGFASTESCHQRDQVLSVKKPLAPKKKRTHTILRGGISKLASPPNTNRNRGQTMLQLLRKHRDYER